jgi:hypothetical protein
MNKSLKSALLSALIFPGCGHFFLKKNIQGALLAVVAMLCLILLMSAVIDTAQAVAVRIQTGEIPLDINQITSAIRDQRASDSAGWLNGPLLVFSLCWIVGVVDAYRVGRSHSRSKGA